MYKNADITPTLIRQLIRFEPETEKYFWNPRPVSMFSSPHACASWNSRYAGKRALNSPNGNGYLRGSILQTAILAHRVIWAFHYGAWPEGEIDHINQNKADNRISNLRVVTHTENCRNFKLARNNKSGCSGVNWHKAKERWGVTISHTGKSHNLGYFFSKEEAIAVRKKAEAQYGYHKNHGGVVCTS